MTILSTTTVLLLRCSTSFYRTSPADLSPTRTDPLRIRHRDWHFFDPGLIHMAKFFSTIIDLLQNNVSSFFHEFWRGGLQRPKFKAICVVPISAFAGVGSSFQWKTHFQQNLNSAPICWNFWRSFFTTWSFYNQTNNYFWIHLFESLIWRPSLCTSISTLYTNSFLNKHTITHTHTLSLCISLSLEQHKLVSSRLRSWSVCEWVL